MDLFLKRFRLWRRSYIHVVIYTSLFWIFVDVFFIMIFSDCTREKVVPCTSHISHEIVDRKPSESGINNGNINPKFRNMSLENSKLEIEKEKDSKKRKYRKPQSKSGIIASIFGSNSGSNPSYWPGESGQAVRIPENLKEEAKTRFRENQFNIVASDLMALNRSINDQRSSK